MKAVVQRVVSASVTVHGEVVGTIGKGMCVFLGVVHTDTEQEAEWLAKKIAGLRIFSNDEGKMSFDIVEAAGECLVVSQFTLAASCDRGRRPDFGCAAEPGKAQVLYELFVEILEKSLGRRPATGRFRAPMHVSLINDGPVTFVVESK